MKYAKGNRNGCQARKLYGSSGGNCMVVGSKDS